jgi:hypothetical protein
MLPGFLAHRFADAGCSGHSRRRGCRWPVVLWGRTLMKTSGETDQSFVRSWLALTVIGLVLFCGVSLFLSDTNLRSVLIGGLTASAGTAIAFYFSSKSADQARQDILKATFGTETVPDLKGCTREKALGRHGQTALQHVADPASSTADDATVVSQTPVKDSQVLKGSQVVVKLDSAAPAADGDQPRLPTETSPRPPTGVIRLRTWAAWPGGTTRVWRVVRGSGSAPGGVSQDRFRGERGRSGTAYPPGRRRP